MALEFRPEDFGVVKHNQGGPIQSQSAVLAEPNPHFHPESAEWRERVYEKLSGFLKSGKKMDLICKR